MLIEIENDLMKNENLKKSALIILLEKKIEYEKGKGYKSWKTIGQRRQLLSKINNRYIGTCRRQTVKNINPNKEDKHYKNRIEKQQPHRNHR